MKVPNSLADTICLIAGVQPARQRRPGERFELGENPQPSYRWLWLRLIAALPLLIFMIGMVLIPQL